MATDKLNRLDQKIQLLKEKKDKLQTQLALSFLKETQRICGNEFSLELVLVVLEQIWTLSSEIQKQEWEQRAHSFRPKPFLSNCKNPQTTEATHYES